MIEKVYNMSTRTEYVIEPVIKDDYVHYMHMVLHKGQALPTHFTNANIYMTVVTGTLTLSLSDEEFKVYPSGSIINIPFRIKMIAQNEHDEILELFVVKTPAPGSEIYK
ncbi:MAG TPA: hypothetical protein GX730_00495 [Chloroflexi bacterium]|jgi:quercetin dioxygenase-like cupin family protein|nr:hypothetical protein [Chloroflexota bacterium]